ncbi:MAG TPA: hypothetical protein VK509_15095 [Polyangiales bacterium]|nr:hypothetical protein [Polyangiales bacterium]
MNAAARARVLARVFVGVLASALAISARAQPQASAPAAAPSSAQPIVLNLPNCLDAPSADVAKLVALELAPRLRVVPGVGAGAQVRLTATVVCPAGQHARLTVDDPARTTPLRVELDLARTAPEARARLLALTLAELIATSRLERAATAPPGTATRPGSANATAPANANANAKDEEEDEDDDEDDEADEDEDEDDDDSSGADGDLGPAAEPKGPLRIWLAPGFSRAGAPGTLLFGVDAGAGYELGPFVLGLELQGRWGHAGLDEAEVNVRMFSAAITATPALALGEVELLLGPGLRVGYGRLAATSLRDDLAGDTLEGAFLGPIAVAAAQLDVSRYSALRCALEIGYAARSLVGNAPGDRELLALRGAWLSATLGLALQL